MTIVISSTVPLEASPLDILLENSADLHQVLWDITPTYEFVNSYQDMLSRVLSGDELIEFVVRCSAAGNSSDREFLQLQVQLLEAAIKKGGDLNEMLSHLNAIDPNLFAMCKEVMVTVLTGNNLMKLALKWEGDNIAQLQAEVIALGKEKNGDLNHAFASLGHKINPSLLALHKELFFNMLGGDNLLQLALKFQPASDTEIALQKEALNQALQKGGNLNQPHIMGMKISFQAFSNHKDFFTSNLTNKSLIQLVLQWDQRQHLNVEAAKLRLEILECNKENAKDISDALADIAPISSELLASYKEIFFCTLPGEQLMKLALGYISELEESRQLRKEYVEVALEKGADLTQALLQALASDQPGLQSLLVSKMDNPEAALELAARSKHTDIVQYLLGMGFKLPAPLLGITNQYGDWSSNVFQAVTAVSENTIVLPLESRHVSDMNFMQKFSGFINPGAADTYPKIGEFSMLDIDQEHMHSHETDYQNVLRFATAHKVPYIGICAGSQHLALNRNGSLHPVKGYCSDDHEVTFIPGSASHFFALTPDEQRSALTHCQLPEITIKNVHTEHNYAAVADKLGEGVSLGALSEEGVVQSLGLGLIHVGFQFHPEDHYSLSMEPLVNREKNIFNTFSKLVLYHHAQTHNAGGAEESLGLLESKIMERLAECVDKTMPPSIFPARDQCLAEKWEFTDILHGQYW